MGPPCVTWFVEPVWEKDALEELSLEIPDSGLQARIHKQVSHRLSSMVLKVVWVAILILGIEGVRSRPISNFRTRVAREEVSHRNVVRALTFPKGCEFPPQPGKSTSKVFRESS